MGQRARAPLHTLVPDAHIVDVHLEAAHYFKFASLAFITRSPNEYDEDGGLEHATPPKGSLRTRRNRRTYNEAELPAV